MFLLCSNYISLQKHYGTEHKYVSILTYGTVTCAYKLGMELRNVCIYRHNLRTK